MTDPTTLSCPSCGAPLDVDGRSAIIQCKFCKANVLLPGLPARATAPASPAALAEIRRLAQSGNMIEAIRRYRELYNTGLKEAKEAVESLAAGGVMEARLVVTGPLTPEQIGRVLEEVQELLRSGNKIEAIRRYREAADVSLTKAKDVVDQVEAALTGIPVPTQPEITGLASSSQPQATRNRRSWLGCWIGLISLLFFGGVLALVLSQVGSPFNPLLIANGPAILLPNQGGASDVAAAFYDATDESYLVGLVEADTGKLLWRSAPLPGDGYVDGIARDSERIYATSGANLLAYRIVDGSPAWQATMPDRLNYGAASLLVTGGRVLTMNLDQSVQAYDAVTGVLVWSRRLAGYDRTLRLVGNSLVLFDQLGDDSTYSLVFLDPANGSEERILTPACPYDEYSTDSPNPDSGFMYDQNENSLYLVYDSSPGCLQRLALPGGQPAWQTLDEEWYNFSPNGFNSLFTDTRLYFSNDDQLLAVDKGTGVLQKMLINEDYDFLPLAVSGDTLIVRARRTRGSERFELWGLEASSGATLWQMDMGTAKPIDPPGELVGLVDEGEAGWTWNLLAGQLVLVRFQAAPNQLVIQSIDPASGSLRSETSVELKAVTGDFYGVPTVIGWDGDRIYFSLDAKIYNVDVSTGEVLFHYR